MGSGGEAEGADAFKTDSMFAANGNTIYCTLLLCILILTDNSLLSGSSARGAVPLAESLEALEAADGAADEREGETNGFRPSVPAQTASQDDDTVAGQQH